jgi:hypothetical protein
MRVITLINPHRDTAEPVSTARRSPGVVDGRGMKAYWRAANPRSLTSCNYTITKRIMRGSIHLA